MRLLNTTTYELKEFIGSSIPQYAILSHTWSEEEVTFQDIQQLGQGRWKNGFSKIAQCCSRAASDDIGWAWIDTCCIDRSSSAELSEAINSMYNWYENSEVCYAYLYDVPPLGPSLNKEKFRAARWFTRGWCLQELIAPRELEFYGSDWTEIGRKSDLVALLSEITGIRCSILEAEGEHVSSCSVGERMAWSANRQTTRIEDTAYCLLGIFEINMPLLYGEGNRAFTRLQEEILKHYEDYTLFLWRSPSTITSGSVFADSPAWFFQPSKSQGASTVAIYYSSIEQSILFGRGNCFSNPNKLAFRPPQITSRGLRIRLLTRKPEAPFSNFGLLAWLFSSCIVEGKPRLLCIRLDFEDRYLDIEQPEEFIYYYRDCPDLIEAIPEDELPSFELRELYIAARIPSQSLRHVPLAIHSFTIRCPSPFNVEKVDYVRGLVDENGQMKTWKCCSPIQIRLRREDCGCMCECVVVVSVDVIQTKPGIGRILCEIGEGKQQAFGSEMITIPHGDGLRAATKIRRFRLILDLSFWKGEKLRSKGVQEITYPMS